MNTLIPRQLAVENGDGHDNGSSIIARVWTSMEPALYCNNKCHTQFAVINLYSWAHDPFCHKYATDKLLTSRPLHNLLKVFIQ